MFQSNADVFYGVSKGEAPGAAASTSTEGVAPASGSSSSSSSTVGEAESTAAHATTSVHHVEEHLWVDLDSSSSAAHSPVESSASAEHV